MRNIFCLCIFIIVLGYTNGCASPGKKAAEYASPAMPSLEQLKSVINEEKLSNDELALIWESALKDYYHGANKEVVRYLVANIDVNLKNPHQFNMTPLMMACTNSYNSAEIFEILIERGADIHAKLQYVQREGVASNSAWKYSYRLDGSTPLHFCSGEYKLLEAGFTRDNLNIDGALILKNHGADSNIKNAEGRTPYDSYIAGKEQEAVAIEGERRRKAARRNQDNDLNMAQILAIAGGAAVASSSNLSGAQKTDFMTNYTADVLGDTGGTNTRQWGQEQISNNQTNNTGSNSGYSSMPGLASSQSKGRTYSMTCHSWEGCADYSFLTKQELDEFKAKCPKVITGSCPSGASGICTHKNDSGWKAKVYVYDIDIDVLKRKCESEGGSFSN